MDEERLAAIESAILELAEAIRQVCEKVAAIDEEVDKLGFHIVVEIRYT